MSVPPVALRLTVRGHERIVNQRCTLDEHVSGLGQDSSVLICMVGGIVRTYFYTFTQAEESGLCIREKDLVRVHRLLQ